jgi:hypothetical protein
MRSCVVEGQRVKTREGGSQNEKNPAEAGFSKALLQTISGSGLDVRCLLALRSLYDLEADFLTFLERLESVHLDGREMCKQILAAFIGRDESEAFRVVEPFDRTSCHTNFPCNSCPTTSTLEKLDSHMLAAAPSALAHLGIFSYLHLLQPAEKKCQLDCWFSLKKCQENFEMSRNALRIEGFSPFRCVRWRKRARLKSRIIDAHGNSGYEVLGTGCCAGAGEPARDVRYSNGLRARAWRRGAATVNGARRVRTGAARWQHRTAAVLRLLVGRVFAGLRGSPSCLEWVYGNYPGQAGRYGRRAAGKGAETTVHV